MSLIGRFLTGEYAVTRTTIGSYVRGRYTPGPVETIQVCGSMQPTSARELKLPEEGNRIKQCYKFYTDAPILVDSEQTLATGDRITVNGDVFRAMAVTKWENVDLPYYMTIIWREPEQSTDQTRSAP